MRILGAVVAMGLLLGACGDDGGDDAGADPPAAGGGGATGTLAVQLEPSDARFIEGFEVGLRITAGGEVVEQFLWTDFIGTLDEPTLDDYYETVFETTVAAGTVLVEGAFVVGIGPPPVPPDLDGDLPCSVEVDVADGARTTVEVAFNDIDCLREV